MQKHDLFRSEVMQHSSTAALGQIVLIRPLTFTFYAVSSILLVGTLCLLLMSGNYTKKARISGVLVPDRGIFKVIAPSAGIVVDMQVAEGNQIAADAPVVTLSTERASLMQRQTQGTIGRKLGERKASLADEFVKTEALARLQAAALTQRSIALRGEILQLDRELETQSRRVSSGTKQLRRYEDLNTQKFVSDLQVQQKQDELLEQEAKLQSLERTRSTLQRELVQVDFDAKDIPLKLDRERTVTARGIGSVVQDEAENEAKRNVVISAPQNGIVTAVLHKMGASVKAGDTLFTLLPANMQLEAHLFAPSKSVGFIEIGQKVLLRYQAYPYQKFGQYGGTVTAISRAVLEPGELPNSLPKASSAGEAMYRIIVTLNSQTAIAYGKPQALQAGMIVEADVIQDTRKLVEWIFEPLYSLKGRL